MNLLLQLRNKLEEMIDSINLGETELTKTDAYNLMMHIGACCGNKKLYRADLAYKLGISVDDIDKYVYVGKIPEPKIDDDGIEFWYSKELDRIEMENL